MVERIEEHRGRRFPRMRRRPGCTASRRSRRPVGGGCPHRGGSTRCRIVLYSPRGLGTRHQCETWTGSLRSGQGAWHRRPRRDGGVPRCSLDDTRVFHVDDDEQLVRVHGDPHPVLPDELSDVPDILAKVSRQAAVQTGTRSEEFSWTISSSRSPEWSRPGINPLLCIGPALRERPFATRETDRQSPTRKFATFTNFRYETTRVRGIMGGPVSPAGIRPPALSDETFPLQVLQDSSHPHSISGDPGGHFFFGD